MYMYGMHVSMHGTYVCMVWYVYVKCICLVALYGRGGPTEAHGGGGFLGNFI